MDGELAVIGVVIRVLVALGPAVLIGLERELSSQPAGLRTHVLLSLGAVLFTLAGIGIMDATPSRVAAQVASGVGFLGAGAILQERFQVRGLTTAASLWVTAAVGVAAGAGSYLAVGVVTVVALLVLTALKWVEREFFPRRRGQALAVTFTPGVRLSEVYEKVRHIAGQIEIRRVEPAPDGGQRMSGNIHLVRTRDLLVVAEELQALPEVTGVDLSR